VVSEVSLRCLEERCLPCVWPRIGCSRLISKRKRQNHKSEQNIEQSSMCRSSSCKPWRAASGDILYRYPALCLVFFCVAGRDSVAGRGGWANPLRPSVNLATSIREPLSSDSSPQHCFKTQFSVPPGMLAFAENITCYQHTNDLISFQLVFLLRSSRQWGAQE
jgi:hypothetical protein